MSMSSVTLTNNVVAAALLKKAVKPRHADGYGATILASGTFGGGTLAFFLSPDNGTTQIAAQKTDGTPATFTAPGDLNIALFVGNSLREPGIGIYYTLLGATNPSIVLTCSDNKG